MTHSLLKCECCGATIWEHENRFTDGKYTFCSVTCKNDYAAENQPRPVSWHPELSITYPQQQLELGLA